MPERTFSSPEYRYGFNGKEKDEEGEWGSLTHYDYGFRIYNPGIGRFLSVDPLTQAYPFYTPYQFAGNKPIWKIDLDGLEEATPEIQERVNNLTAKYQGLVDYGREWGYNLAANNLSHFLEGSGTDQHINTEWLREYKTVQYAEDRIMNFFLTKKKNFPRWIEEAKNLNVGETTVGSDYWEGRITGTALTELFFASNASEIVGTGRFNFTKESETTIEIQGSVVMNWFDAYNWNEGSGAWVPGQGWFRDDDAIFLEENGIAESYGLFSAWTYNYSGTYNLSTKELENSKWTLRSTNGNLTIELTPITNEAGRLLRFEFSVPEKKGP